MAVTIKDLAMRAGVTETTVSLSFQKNSRISDRTRKKILALAQEMNYVPSMAARQLRQGKSKTRTLGMLVNDITNPFYGLMIQVAEEAASRRGFEMIIADSQWSAEKELAEVENMVEYRAEGILACFCEKDRDSLELLHRFSVPFLVLDTYPADYIGPYIANDLAEAGRLGARHLIDIGCRRPAFLTADPGMQTFSSFAAMRHEFTRTLVEQGFEYAHIPIIHAGLTIEAGLKAYERLTPDIDGVFSVSTLCALGVQEAARKSGRQLAIMGVDDLDICRLSSISLTTIRQPYEQLAQIAIDVLINSIEEKKAPTVKMSLKPELVVRDSTNRQPS